MSCWLKNAGSWASPWGGGGGGRRERRRGASGAIDRGGAWFLPVPVSSAEGVCCGGAARTPEWPGACRPLLSKPHAELRKRLTTPTYPPLRAARLQLHRTKSVGLAHGSGNWTSEFATREPKGHGAESLSFGDIFFWGAVSSEWAPVSAAFALHETRSTDAATRRNTAGCVWAAGRTMPMHQTHTRARAHTQQLRRLHG